MVGPIFTIHMSYDVFLCKEVPFGDWDKAAPHLRGVIPKTFVFWCVNRCFQAKLVKYQHFHTIETAASIPTKFCTVIKTTKYSLWVSKHANNKSKMVEWLPFLKYRNLHI